MAMPVVAPTGCAPVYPQHKYSELSVAQQTSVSRTPTVLDKQEIASLRSACRAARDRGLAVQHLTDTGHHRTTYLHACTADVPAAILQKLICCMEQADRRDWKLLPVCGEYAARCVEYHEYSDGAGLEEEEHHDRGSYITLDLMLSDSRAFEGGEFCTLEVDGTLQTHAFEQGDALVFVSHKFHCVRPVRAGTREVLIIELWSGPQRSCPHRCLDPQGVCDREQGDGVS